MIIHLTLKSAQHSSHSGGSEEPELRGKPFETVTLEATGGAVIVNLHTVEQAEALVAAAEWALLKIRKRQAAQQAAE